MRPQQHGGQNWHTIIEDGLIIVPLAFGRPAIDEGRMTGINAVNTRVRYLSQSAIKCRR